MRWTDPPEQQDPMKKETPDLKNVSSQVFWYVRENEEYIRKDTGAFFVT